VSGRPDAVNVGRCRSDRAGRELDVNRLRRTCDRHYGLGPLAFYPEGDGAPGDAEGGGSTPAPKPPDPPAQPAPPNPSPEQTVPYARFEEVARENRALKAAEEARQTEEEKRQGNFEKLSEKEKAAREAAEERALRFARRAGFVSQATGKVVDVDAAYTLAQAQGMLDEVEIDDEGNVKDPPKIDGVITELLKRHEFLKVIASRKDFGDHKGGQSPSGGDRPKTAIEMLQAGYGDK